MSKQAIDLREGQAAMSAALASCELGFEVAIAERLESVGVYDLSRLESRHPRIYQAARKCILSCVSPSKTAELLSLDIRTVNLVVERLEAENLIPPYKERTVWNLRAVVTLAVDQLLDRARAGGLGALDVAILIDKIELLSGGVTARIETRTTEAEKESDEFFRRARRELSRSPVMDLEAEVVPQGAALLPAPGPAVLVPAAVPELVTKRDAGDL